MKMYQICRSAWQKEKFRYLLVSTILFVVSLVTLCKNGYIVGGDIFPDYIIGSWSELKESLSLWGTTITGLGTAQYSSVTFVWALWATLWHMVGISGPVIQFLFMTALLIFQGVGTLFFVRTLLPKEPVVGVLAALAIPLSLTNALAFFNPIGAFAIGYFPWFAGLLLRFLQRPERQWIMGVKLALGGMGLYVLSGTPPLAAFFVIWCLFWTVYGWLTMRTFRQTYLGLLLTVGISLALHAWWAYAAYVTLYGSPDTIQQTFAGPLSWSFVHQRASILNLLSMQGFWAWPDQQYFPWSSSYRGGILHASLYFPAAFAFVGLISRSYKREKLVLVSILLLSLFINKGIHAPFIGLNLWMYKHLPGFWLFRDPQVEWNIAMFLSMFVLAALGVTRIFTFVSILPRKFSWKSAYVYSHGIVWGVILMTALLLNGYAFYTGAFSRESHDYSTKSVVQIPEYWREAADYLNKQAKGASILMLPNNDFYQMTYNWGFHGADQIARALIKPNVVRLELNTGGYLSGSKGKEAYFSNLLMNIKHNPQLDITPSLQSIGVSWVVLRKDIVTDLPNRDIIDTAYLSRYLAGQPGMVKMMDFGSLEIYKLKQPSSIIQGFTGTASWEGEDAPAVNEAAMLTGQGTPWTQAASGSTGQGWKQAAFTGDGQMLTPEAGALLVQPYNMKVTVQPLDDQTLRVDLQGSRFRDSSGGEQGWKRTVPLHGDWKNTKAFILDIDSVQYFIHTKNLQENTPLYLGDFHVETWSNAVPVTLLSTSQEPIPVGDWSDAGDCNAYDKRSKDEVGIRADLSHDADQQVQLKAREHAACVKKETKIPVQAGQVLWFNASYKNVSGEAAEARILLDDEVLKTLKGEKGSDWKTWNTWFDVTRSGVLKFFVYAYGQPNATAASVNAYKKMEVWSVNKIDQESLDLTGASFTVPKGTITRTDLTGPKELFNEANWSPLFNANHYESLPDNETELRAEHDQGVLTLRAKKQAAGQSQTFTGVGGRTLNFHVEARGEKGISPPVVKVFDNKDALVWASDFSAGSAEWQTREATLNLSPEETSITIYFYSYAEHDGPSVKHYRNLSLKQSNTPESDFIWVQQGLAVPSAPVTWKKLSNAHYQASVDPSAKVLVFNQSYHGKWQVQSHGKTLGWEHVKVNGLMNGWLIPDHQTVEQVDIVFVPSQKFELLKGIGLGTVLLSILLVGLAPWLRRHRREQVHNTAL